MNLKMPQLVALTASMVLLYSAIKDVSPAEVLKAVLTGKPLPTNNLPPWTQATDSNGNPDGGFNGDGKYIPRTDQNTPQPQPKKSPDGSGPQTNVPTVYRSPYGTAPVVSV